ncbi:Elongation of very long chain fatty acids protein [Aphelenchoides fujianensis]|nr:Elongation of very long chain fatty acids protein [Aphelenchoides fujianensis]
MFEFEVYRDNKTDTLHTDYVYKYSLPFERVHDKYGWTLLFQKYCIHSFAVAVIYYVIIRWIQHAMRNREPFSLQKPLFFWNASLGRLQCDRLRSIRRGSLDFLVTWSEFGLTHALCHSCNPDSVAAFWSLAFAISKFVELGDTLFIVLRKKPLIFLHYFHHAAVLVYTIHSAFITMNYFAHAFMYTYYAIKALEKRLPRYVSMTVTTIQTLQMFAGVAVSCYVAYIKLHTDIPCQQSKGNLVLAFIIYIAFAFLFCQFYYKAYLRPRTTKKKVQ